MVKNARFFHFWTPVQLPTIILFFLCQAILKMPHAVQIQALSHIFNKKIQALDNISLTIPRGATVGLIGPDGVGKSTLLSIIAGVRKIQTGSVCVLGGDMTNKHDRQDLSHRIAYMPQGLGKNLYPTLTVQENIDFHARLFGLSSTERKARIQRLLDATNLAPFLDRAAGKLSGGMKQKLSLCCALVHNPDFAPPILAARARFAARAKRHDRYRCHRLH